LNQGPQMSNKICIQCNIFGRVQGVWYRASAQQEATKLGLTGWAKNMPDGSVEVIACGDEEQIQSFLTWLKKGSDNAEVEEMIYEEINYQEFEDFKTY
jgi:acylphosphatase